MGADRAARAGKQSRDRPARRRRHLRRGARWSILERRRGRRVEARRLGATAPGPCAGDGPVGASALRGGERRGSVQGRASLRSRCRVMGAASLCSLERSIAAHVAPRRGLERWNLHGGAARGRWFLTLIWGARSNRLVGSGSRERRICCPLISGFGPRASDSVRNQGSVSNAAPIWTCRRLYSASRWGSFSPGGAVKSESSPEF